MRIRWIAGILTTVVLIGVPIFTAAAEHANTAGVIKGWVTVTSATQKIKGVSGYSMVHKHTGGEVSQPCPSGKKVVGGGDHVVGEETEAFHVRASRPTDNGAGWLVSYIYTGKPNIWLNVYGICANTDLNGMRFI